MSDDEKKDLSARELEDVAGGTVQPAADNVEGKARPSDVEPTGEPGGTPASGSQGW